uniref:Uncharacterized protein n=1 Tax=viral metagenome TaxID=1070528 RepID=A0A6C0EU31_9ZZZZ
MPTIGAFELYMLTQERKKLRDEKFKMDQKEKRINYDYERDEILMKEEERRDKIDKWREKRTINESFSEKKKREEKEEEIYNNL